jgi:antirestriction protein ArdC
MYAPYAKPSLTIRITGNNPIRGTLRRTSQRVSNNSAAYIAGWMKALTHDPKCIVTAAGAAQKAADYILNTPNIS